MGESVRAPLLQLSSVGKTYGERVVTEVLKDIDLTLESGEFCALTGPSGSGKTTLLNLIGLLDRPTTGDIVIDGRNVGGMDDEGRTEVRGTRLGFVFQFHHLLPAFTAEENVMMPLVARHGRTAAWMREKARALLDQVGLAERARYKSTDLSGGEQQRVAIARTLISDPMLVLADEPTGNLDTETSRQVFALLKEFNQRSGVAFLIVTHDPGVAAQCAREIHMVDGRIESDRRSPSSARGGRHAPGIPGGPAAR